MTIKLRLSQPNPAAVWTVLTAGEAVGESADLPGLDVTVSACWLLQSSLDVTVRHSFSSRQRDRCSSGMSMWRGVAVSFCFNFSGRCCRVWISGHRHALLYMRSQERAGGKHTTDWYVHTNTVTWELFKMDEPDGSPGTSAVQLHMFASLPTLSTTTIKHGELQPQIRHLHNSVSTFQHFATDCRSKSAILTTFFDSNPFPQAFYFENLCHSGEPALLPALIEEADPGARDANICVLYCTLIWNVHLVWHHGWVTLPLPSSLLPSLPFQEISRVSRDGKRSPPKHSLIHRKFAWGAHQDREDRRAHRVSFGLSLRPSPPPLPPPPPPLPPFDLFS